ncbi:MAG: thioredoxin-dependent thiol peroxidase [Bacteroidota bacterium]|nr:thioredoxin-dependent thiol peroxidase [Bacteroidota bacterium]
MILKVGDKAPEIKSKDENGNDISLSSFLGKKVVLYFYPKDDTPGCTAESCNLRDNEMALKAAGYQILGVSVDDVKSHKKFKTKYNLPFPLIADPEQKIVNDYGIWVEKSMYGKKYMGTARTTFLLDENGIITKIIDKVDTKEHTSQILE